MSAAIKLGIAVPKDCDRYQMQRLLSEVMREVNDNAQACLRESGIKPNAVVAFEGADWIVTLVTSDSRVCLRRHDGAATRVFRPVQRRRDGTIHLRVQHRFTPPPGYMHPYSLGSDDRLTNVATLASVRESVNRLLHSWERTTTSFGEYWFAEAVDRIVEDCLEDLRFSLAAWEQTERAAAYVARRTDEAAKRPAIRWYCAACGTGIAEISPQAERRCVDCRADEVRLGPERHCVTCGARFTAEATRPGRWHCADHRPTT